MKIELSSLQPGVSHIDAVLVHSYEMSIYLVEITIDGTPHMLCERGKPKRFVNTQQIRDCFAQFNLKEASMVHESPYDEMIGNPPSAQSRHPIPFSLTQPY